MRSARPRPFARDLFFETPAPWRTAIALTSASSSKRRLSPHLSRPLISFYLLLTLFASLCSHSESEYRAWQSNVNGIKQQSGSGYYFGVINLLAPRDPLTQSRSWHANLTFVQLRFEFVSGSWGAGATHGGGSTDSVLPLNLTRTYISFFDFDMGQSGQAAECLMFQPSDSLGSLLLSNETDVYLSNVNASSAKSLLPDSDVGSSWEEAQLACATVTGVGADNPYRRSQIYSAAAL